jgi:DNA ligase 1
MSIQDTGGNRRAFGRRVLAWTGIATGLTCHSAAQAKAMPDVQLAREAPKGIDPKGYLVSEKYDGVRALWDGSVLRFRSGRTVAAPDWFTAKLPATALDGELWRRRGNFDALSATVRKNSPVDIEWQSVNYMVFDAPQTKGPFSLRAAELQDLARTVSWAQFQAVEHWTLPDARGLQDKLKAVTQAGGEGLMLHLASAPVSSGRSDVLLKLKPLHDAEALVTGHVNGKGRLDGMLGALEVQTAGGQRFRLGTGFSEDQRRNPPAIGSQVTYTYNELTPSGKPRFARFLRIYND